jgi:hypothetical protein
MNLGSVVNYGAEDHRVICVLLHSNGKSVYYYVHLCSIVYGAEVHIVHALLHRNLRSSTTRTNTLLTLKAAGPDFFFFPYLFIDLHRSSDFFFTIFFYGLYCAYALRLRSEELQC